MFLNVVANPNVKHNSGFRDPCTTQHRKTSGTSLCQSDAWFLVWPLHITVSSNFQTLRLAERRCRYRCQVGPTSWLHHWLLLRGHLVIICGAASSKAASFHSHVKQSGTGSIQILEGRPVGQNWSEYLDVHTVVQHERKWRSPTQRGSSPPSIRKTRATTGSNKWLELLASGQVQLLGAPQCRPGQG